jgi:hypothetical protein
MVGNPVQWDVADVEVHLPCLDLHRPGIDDRVETPWSQHRSPFVVR